MKQLVIVDYGSGNLHSISKAFEKEAINKKIDIKVSDNYKDIERSSHIVLPGVGAYNDCMAGLQRLDGVLESIQHNVLDKKKPFLGICVGMQLLSDTGEENGLSKGLGWISGDVQRFSKKDTNLKIPHMGWNEVYFQQKHDIFKNIEDKTDFYFVHSYHFSCKDDNNVLACAEYGRKFSTVIAMDNIVASQFHPEKSQKAGLEFISNFLKFKC